MHLYYAPINVFPVLLLFLSISAYGIENTPLLNKADDVIAAPYHVGWWDRARSNLSETWSRSPDQDIYLPVITWHNRWMYDKEKTDDYNERPWGAGYGVSRVDADGDWHGVYLMAFKDSFNKWEPIGGYGFEKRWQPTRNQDFQLGAGFTAGVTMRDNWHYLPVPILLPLFSLRYQRATFQATYIPGTYNNGNVLFAWLRWQI